MVYWKKEQRKGDFVMKRIFILFLTLVLCCGFVACGEPGENETSVLQSDREESSMSDQTQTNTEATVIPGDPVSLTLKYDDRYTFPDAIEEIETVSVTSFVAGTEKADTRVMRKQSNVARNVGIAIGVGEAKVTLKNGQVYHITVEPAPLSVLLIAGQSNGEGSTTGEAEVYNKARNQSIVCEEGQVYSTYAWSTTGHSTYVAGLSSKKALTPQNAAEFVAKSLTTSTTRAGGTLEYSLNSLSAAGNGKTGFDSGLAWNWHELTGDKVWVVNCAAGSTAIEVWQPGELRYENCVALMAQVRATLEDEIAAGHYTLNHFVYFWLQGESNKGTSQEDYARMFETMHQGFKEQVLAADGKTLEGCGIVMVRAFETTSPSIDTVDNGPRKAQKAAIAATEGVCADVFLACIANDEWISSKNIIKYWETKYPQSEYPFQVQASPYENPMTIAEVHNGVHYFQPGYNEIGIVAAENTVAMFEK